MTRLSRIYFFVVILILTCCSFCERESSLPQTELSFSVDTLFLVKIGDAPGMINQKYFYPSLFRVAENYMYVMLRDGKTLIYNLRGEFIAEKVLPVNVRYIRNIAACKNGLIIIGMKKIYQIDTAFSLVDSFDYYPGTLVANTFIIHENVYLSTYLDTTPNLLVFNTNDFSLKQITPLSIWGAKYPDGFGYPFSDEKDTSVKLYKGASKKLMVAMNPVGKNGSCIDEISVYDFVTKRLVDLDGFCYGVYVTNSPSDAFQFINDSTAIFTVRYYDEGRRERDCVFYRIIFSTN